MAHRRSAPRPTWSRFWPGRRAGTPSWCSTRSGSGRTRPSACCSSPSPSRASTASSAGPAAAPRSWPESSRRSTGGTSTTWWRRSGPPGGRLRRASVRAARKWSRMSMPVGSRKGPVVDAVDHFGTCHAHRCRKLSRTVPRSTQARRDRSPLATRPSTAARSSPVWRCRMKIACWLPLTALALVGPLSDLAHAQWDPGGTLVSPHAYYPDPNRVVAVPDGMAGALILSPEIGASGFAHEVLRVGPDGSFPSGWPSTALEASFQSSGLAADGTGGAYVGKIHQGPSGMQIVVHHVLADGSLDPGWPAGGRVVAELPGLQNVQLAPDGSGGF